MGKVFLLAECRPSTLMRNMTRHRGDVSEGTQLKVIARRRILNKRVTFYHNGLRVIKGVNLNEQEVHESEVLRLAHASLLIGSPVGDKRACYVDATKDPVEVWVYGLRVEEFIKTPRCLTETQKFGLEFLLEEPMRNNGENNGRNVRLPRR